MSQLILKRNSIGQNPDDYNVLENGAVVGRIFLSRVAPEGRPWMWASGHNGDIRRAAHGYPLRPSICYSLPGAYSGAEYVTRLPRPGSATHVARDLSTRFLDLLGVGVVYFFLAKIGLTLASINPSASAIWPATGFALAGQNACLVSAAPVVGAIGSAGSGACTLNFSTQQLVCKQRC
jgi:hypothetical protein